ncbi:sensor histidine kinase [Agromyces albus]|uniref:histidine kinase n=1 Tax=Agromyces albus TaxID=205332 RepID=A0A4Q2L496_9MICO|nr:histidine kinase [Agromyces albus]RXZ73024.1 sensor histidine kinase [Agromyces albus]
MTSPLRSVWEAPAAQPPPPRRVWRDWVLVGVIPVIALLEGLARPDLPWRVLWVVVLIAVVPTLLWRRTHPLPMLAIAFATTAIVTVLTGADSQFATTAYFLILIYAVVRWGSGRAMLLGSAIVLASFLLSLLLGPLLLSDVIGSVAVLAMTTTLGVAFRGRAAARARELDRVKLQEREQLARDLHDTVAHHVSAIAIQAQAGTAVAATDPDAAVEVLRVIEREASRTLAEMRSIVRVLRREDGHELAPSPTIADLRQLVQPESGGPVVDLQLTGDIEAVPPTIAATVYRLAQEGVTNARRHARNTTRIEVLVHADAAGIRLDVRDDGDPAASAAPGYGITGMIERATLLGGTCQAAPAPDGGWVVTAVLPRSGWST